MNSQQAQKTLKAMKPNKRWNDQLFARLFSRDTNRGAAHGRTNIELFIP